MPPALASATLEYARDNKSFGLTTLRNRHVTFVRDGRAVLNFRGKGGVQHEIPIDDRRIVRIVQRCQELPGQHLFQYVADDGSRCPVDSGQVNDYLREAMGDDFTAKDFRTWGATLRALVLLARIPKDPDASERALKRAIAGVVKQVAIGATQHARGVPQVLHQSGRVRRMALGGNPQCFRRKSRDRLDAQGREAGAQLSQATYANLNLGPEQRFIFGNQGRWSVHGLAYR
jgi:DNA topoisomerase IB